MTIKNIQKIMNRRNKMRLIDADVFEEFIRKNCADSLVDLWCELVRRQPTAYDIDGVVEQLECCC